MSPEQARGRQLDKRTDLWSCGCVLYELLSGRPPFVGETVADTLAAVLEHDIDDAALADTPPQIRRLLRRCLAKDPAKRLDSAASARLEIDEVIAEAPVESGRLSPPVNARTRLAIVGMCVMALAGFVAGFLVSPSVRLASDTRRLEARFAIVTPPAWPLNVSGPMRDIAFSPDGRTLAYRAGGSMTAGSALMLRSIDRVDAALVPAADYVYAPFFSPNGRWVGFFSRSELKKVAVTGGPATIVCEFSGAPLGASWGDDGMIAFAVRGPGGGLWRVSADGGEPERLAAPEAIDGDGSYAFPSVLPNGRGVLFTIEKGSQSAAPQVAVAVIDLKTGQRKTLIDGAADAQYVETGHLVFAAGGSLRAVRFNPDRLDVIGEPVPVSESVLVKQGGAADYTLTSGGTLAYVTAESGLRPPRSLVWVDRRGREEPLDVPQRHYGPGRISPDGTRVAIGIMDNGSADIWVFDVNGGAPKRLTFAPGTNGLPVWTPDGRQIIFSMYDPKGVLNLYRQPADGREPYQSITSSQIPQWPSSVTPDGTRVIGFDLGRPPRPGGVIVVPLLGGMVSNTVVESLFDGDFAESSPDGRYLAYQSTESGRSEIYVRAFPDVHNGPWQISTAGGTRPAWSRDGRELFYLDAANAMNVVRVVTSGQTFVSGPPEILFTTGYYEPNPARHYDVSADGRRFLMIKENPMGRDATPASMVVVQNWQEELKQRVPTR
jgi:serine/threonine-protein kinase